MALDFATQVLVKDGVFVCKISAGGTGLLFSSKNSVVSDDTDSVNF